MAGTQEKERPNSRGAVLTIPLDSAPSVLPDDSEPVLAALPSLPKIAPAEDFGGENCCPFRAPPKRFGMQAPLLMASAPLSRTLSN